MTAIANWINKENDSNSIWTIGDTKISDISTNTNLSLESSKIFELQIICKDISKHPQRRDVYYSHSIGFAFAGSSLVGLNCYATLNTILSNLAGSGDEIPDLESISSIVSKVVDYYSKSICSNMNNFEALTYGFCHKTMKFKRFYISKKNILNDVIYCKEEIKDENLVYLIGDMKNEIFEEIKNKMILDEKDKNLKYWRTPLIVMSEIIASGKYQSIGGGTQLNIADFFGCKPYQSAGEINQV
ncbi:MAG: hypothetical protein ABI549_04000 [Flavobacterium sp.]|uniref:hypothetical protein n=1 Tax=Flavobacterium sp. TaxID=239 RepID=UPI003264C0E3